MNFEDLARQLRKPEGEAGIAVGENMNKGNAGMYQLVLSQMDIQNQDHILEIGFGNGKHIADFLQKGQGVFYAGIDFSETMVDACVNFNNPLIVEDKIEIQNATVSDIPYPDAFFDKVFTTNTIYFWPEPQSDMKELYRVIKNGGKIFIGIRPRSSMEKLPFVKHGFTTYEFEDVKLLMLCAGFKNISYTLQDESPLKMGEVEFEIQSMCVVGVK
jgi:ubiquinone/menaquinone biosynthesis C-methylase UbiE